MCESTWVVIILLVIVFISGCGWWMSEPGPHSCTIWWFHRPSCGYCVKMSDEWDAFVALKPSYITTKKVDTAKHPRLAREYGVTTVPHIVKEKYGRKSVYKGPRKADDFLRWSMI